MFLEEQVDFRIRSDVRSTARKQKMRPGVSNETLITELGIWLSGIESFLAAGHHSVIDSSDHKGSADASREFRIVHSAIQRCSMLTARIMSSKGSAVSSQTAVTSEIKYGELTDLSRVLRDTALLGQGLISSTSLGTGEWKAWSDLLSSRFARLPVFEKLIRHAEKEGDQYLPSPLAELSASDDLLSVEQAELALVLPRFGRLLRWLSVVGTMLEADEPLKPALLIFARINEQIFELTSYINNRLEYFPDDEAEMFASLDAASYTASIELKKVYSLELAGLAGVRPSPSIYARIETAYSLLNEGFQQMLAGFARITNPETDVFGIFPAFALKRERSLELREELWSVVQVVQKAEAEPKKDRIAAMQKSLRDFMSGPAKYLFYKDTETVERFVEEILVTKENKDLVPILHRFGSYLETLFGQVNLRAVLEKHPFESKN